MLQPESPIEERFRTAWLRRVPHIQLISQYPVQGGRYRLDFAYLPAKIAIELDGYEFHSGRDAFTADRKRDRELQKQGWRVLHFSGREIMDQVDRCVDEVRSVVEAPQISQAVPQLTPRTKTKKIQSSPAITRSSSPAHSRFRARTIIISGTLMIIVLVSWEVLALIVRNPSSTILPQLISTFLSQRTQQTDIPTLSLTTSEIQLTPTLSQPTLLPVLSTSTHTPTLISAPTTSAPLSAQVTNGGNLRSEHRIHPSNVIGQVCPGDRLFILEQQSNGQQFWYRVRVVSLAVSCHPQRVAQDAEGWISSRLVKLL